MPRYGYDYRYQANWNRDLMRGYDRDHGYPRGDYMAGGPGGGAGRYDGGYAQRFTPSYGYDQGYTGQGYAGQGYGQGFAQGYDRPFRPMRGGYGYDQDMGGAYGGRMPAGGQGGGWRDAYQQASQRMRGGWRSPWESPIPGQGLRPGFAFGTGHHGQYM